MYPLVEILVTTAGFALFAFLHTLFARIPVKNYIFRQWPSATRYYRALYTLFSVVLLGGWYAFSPFPEGTVYRVSPPFSLLFYLLQALGGAGILLSLLAVDLRTFIGWSQLRQAADETGDGLMTGGLYRYVRHPLYTATMMVFLFNPAMTARWALTTVLVVLYCWIGSYFEELNLTDRFGDDYRQYRARVPRFIPKIHLF